MPRCAHLDTERLSLVGSRNHTAIIVRQNDNRLPSKLGLEHPFARRIEVVAVNKGETIGHSILTAWQMTPQIS